MRLTKPVSTPRLHVDAGQFVTHDGVVAWLKSWGTSNVGYPLNKAICSRPTNFRSAGQGTLPSLPPALFNPTWWPVTTIQ